MDVRLKSSNAGSTLTDQAYQNIREDILSGKLPPLLRLRVDALKTLYNTGNSPIREALSRLSGDGLVIIEERRGFTVAGISTEELWDITETRVVVEIAALKSSIENAGDGTQGDSWEAQILATFHRLSKLDQKLGQNPPNDAWERVHLEFHESLVAASPYEKLKHIRRQLFDQSERYRRLSLTKTPGSRNVPEEHSEILNATLERNVKKACECLAKHIYRTAEICAVSSMALSEDK
ncbi:GntR family transcriptional regulator [Sneathiella sp.]|uniref:GntR family transcriptional regulator n=1 Tax=Sneathiella sp. TaxID=1964365 RepID=UPI003566AFE8